jgi:cell fate regulator YaaT (PSP1 superfamily)
MTLPTDYRPFDVVEVRFKGSRKEYYRNSEDLDLYTGDYVVVEAPFGHDVGEVSLSGELVRLQLKKNKIDENSETIKKIYRKATEKDLAKYEEVKEREARDLEKARTIAMGMRLQLKMSDIEYQGDGRKVIFYYTAESRVDFRELIKRYAAEFRTRIEMRQVSYREEASRLGGIGSCGRELCCSTWLTDYKVVSMNSAKTQNLSINMLKLSGQCGRLKCCLNYELETYLEALREFPKGDNVKLETAGGIAFHMKTDILKKVMWFAYPKSSDWVALELDRVHEILKMNKNGKKPDTLRDVDEAAVLMEALEPAADLISDQSLTRLDHKEEERKRQRQKKRGKGKFKGKRKGGQNPKGENKPGGKDQGNKKPRGQNPKGRRPKNQKRKPNNQNNKKPTS